MSLQKIVRLAKETFIYGFGGILSKLMNVILLPVLTRLFTLEAYGTIDFITLIITFFTAVCMLGMDSAIGVFFFEQESEEDRRRYFSTFFWGVVILSCVFTLIPIVLAPTIVQYLLDSPALASVFSVACLTVPVTIIFQALITLARFRFRQVLYVTLNAMNIGLNVIAAILFVKFMSMGIVGVFWARVLATSLIILVALTLQSDDIRFDFSPKIYRTLATYGIPLVPLAIITYASNAMGRYFLSIYWTDLQLGIYAFAVKMAAVVGVAFTAFNLAFLPYAAKARFEPDFCTFANKTVKLFLFGAGALVFAAYACSRPLVLIFGTERYLVCESYMILGMLTLLLNASFNIFNIGVCYAKKTIYITISQSIAVIINFVLNLILVPEYGVLGSLLALVTGLLLSNMLVFAISQHVYPISYQTRIIMEILMITVTLGIALHWVSNPLIKVGVLLAYLVWGLKVRKYITIPQWGKLKMQFMHT